MDKVAEPLLLFHKDAEVRLKKLIQAEEKLESGIAALRARIKAERALCVKGWTDLTKEYREWQKSLSAGDAKKIEKLEKNFLAKREKLRVSFLKFEQMVDAANAELRAYWVKELPAIVSAYELLEVERCNELEARLNDFKTIQSEYSQPFPGMLAMVDQSVKAINGPKELKGFVDAVVAQGGKPEAPQAFVDGLPTDSRALLEAANQSTLGALLNQDPAALSAQREATQMQSCGTVLGVGSAAGAASSPQAASSASSLSPPIAAAAASPSASSALSTPTAASALSSSSATGPSSGVAASTDPYNRAGDPPATFVRALYDFTSEDPDDLTFTLNTVIKVTLKGEDDELAAEVESGQADVSAEPRWWRGQRLENIGKSRDGTFPSNYVRVCGVERDMSLRHLLEIPSGLLVFSDFLKQEYASENIAFWQAVELFRERCAAFLAPGDSGELREEGREPMLAEARLIATEFIGHKAASQVNISSATLKLTEDRIAALPATLGLNIFDEAGTHTAGQCMAAARHSDALRRSMELNAFFFSVSVPAVYVSL